MLGRGLKRKRSQEEEEARSASAPPSSSLFSISVSKLHRSLQRGEPDLRHLVLVANTLRRIQPTLELTSGLSQAPGGQACLEDSNLSPCERPAPLPPPLDPLDHLLLSGMDTSVFSILEELTSSFSSALCPPVTQPELLALCEPSPESERTAQLGLSSLEPPGPGGALLEKGLDSLFEDIDTSMYDCDPWAPIKDGCVATETSGQDLADLDYLLEVLVGVEEQ